MNPNADPYLPPPNTLADPNDFMVGYRAATNHTVARPDGVIDGRVPAEWGVGAIDPADPRLNVGVPDTYHARSVFNPVEWTGHANLRGGAWLHRAGQHVGVFPGGPENQPITQWGRTITRLGVLAAGATLALTKGMDYLPDGVHDFIHDVTHENPVKTVVAAAALGAFAVGRTLRNLPNNARDAIGGRPAPGRSPIGLPDWARGWARESWDQLTDTTAPTLRGRIGRAALAGVIGIATKIPGVPIGAFRATVRR